MSINATFITARIVLGGFALRYSVPMMDSSLLQA
jgi:hypothetical protein